MTKFIPLLWVLAAQAVAAPFTQQPPAGDTPAGSRLVAADSVVENGALMITINAEGNESNRWIHLFLDTDRSGPAYTHSTGEKAGESLDFLIEGGIAYRFTGANANEWRWAPVSGAVFSATASEGQARWVLSLESLGLAPQKQVSAFAVTYTPDYQRALDTLPRGEAIWQVYPTKTAPITDTAPAKTRTPAREDARQAFRNINSYACYYGPGNLDQLSQRDAVIIQTRTLGVDNIETLRADGGLVIGYISIGEDEELRTGDKLGPGGYDSAYFDRDGDDKPDRNGIWNSHFANAASPAWRKHFLAKADAILRDSGADGLFLDTVETCLLYTESKPAMVSLIKELRERHPETIIVINRAWDLLPDLGDTVDGIMFESFTLSYDFGSKSYIKIRDSGLDHGLDVWQRLLKPAQDAYDLVALALDYSDKADSPLVAAALDRAVTLGMVPCIANINLDQLYTPTYTPSADPLWLQPKETAESRRHIMDTARNGFPAGTTVSPDSNFADYTITPVVDGLGFSADREALTWHDRAWASLEAPGDHAIEFTLPEPMQARSLKIEWAWEGGAWFPARSFHVEVLTAGAAGAWQTIARIEGNASPQNSVLLPADEITGLRIVQPDGGGSPGRPNLMWVQQVSIAP